MMMQTVMTEEIVVFGREWRSGEEELELGKHPRYLFNRRLFVGRHKYFWMTRIIGEFGEGFSFSAGVDLTF